MKKIILSYLALLFALSLSAQTSNALYAPFIHQANVFPQEKTYVCTDANCYQAGQRISLRVFVVNAITHQPTDMSQYVYVELINPERVTIRRIRLLQNQQTFTGYIDIPDNAAKGRYLLRAYTRNMTNVEGYESTKSIFIGGTGELLSAFDNNLQDSIEVISDNYITINRLKDKVRVSIKDSLLAAKRELWLLGHCRSVPFYFAKVSPHTALVFPLKDFNQDGIHSFVLLDSDLNKLSEQQCFINQKKEFCTLKVSLDSTSQATNGTLPCLITAPDLHPDETMDVAVRLVKSLPKENRDGYSNILSHLLIDEDTRYSLEQPASLLNDPRLDGFIRNHLWQRYNLSAVLKKQYQQPLVKVETTAQIRGKVETLIGHRPIKGGVVNLISPNRGFCAAVKTDEKGQFVFDGMDYPDGTQYVLNAFTKAGKGWVKLYLDEDSYPSFASSLPPFKWLSDNDSLATEAPLTVTDGSIKLDEIHVFSHRPSYASRSDAYARTADYSFGLRDIEDIGATCLHELLRRVPGVTVEFGKCYVRGAMTIEGRHPAAIAVDGIFANEDYDLDNIQMADVERVDVFKTGSTVLWGTAGGMGVISISTKKGNYNVTSVPLTNTKTFTTLGYQTPTPYTPNSHTAYWQPVMRGTSFKIALPALLESGYHLIIEGVTSEGRLIYYVR